MSEPRKHPSTLLAHDGDVAIDAGIAPPLHQTSLFTFDSYADMNDAFAGGPGHYIYSRGNNPTVQRFERAVAELEGGHAARGFASGMAAISAAVMSNLSAGNRIVCVRNVYPDAFKLFRHLLVRFGIDTEYVDATDVDLVAARIQGARILYLESPTSLTFTLQDIPRLSRIAHEAGALVIVDNSWATPLYHRPLEAGADLVVHSASKYLSGHSDVVAGVAAGTADAIERINRLEYGVLGGKLSPFEAWLLVRGMRTLVVRLARHRQSALEVARYLSTRPEVQAVHHPGLPNHPQASLFQRDFTGSSGLFSFEMAEAHAPDIERFVDALELFHLGVSWGGYESLVYPASIGRVAAPAPNAATEFDVSPALVRLHVGLEEPSDLIADLDSAFERMKGGGGRG